MTNKTKKTKNVRLYNLDDLVKLYNQFEERGEMIKDISFKDDDDNFKFQNNRLSVWAWWSNISSITVKLEEDNKIIRRTYEPELNLYSINDLRVTYESVSYIY